MKRNHISGSFLVLLVMIIFCSLNGKAQMVNEVAKKRVTIGVGMFNDIWFNLPAGIKTRTINQGFQTYVMYNVPFGKSNFGFAIGLGFRAQNMYGNFQVDSKIDSTTLVRIPDSANYRRSKLTLPYLELPIEFKFKSKSKIAVGIGFKIAYLLPAHTKFVGEDYYILKTLEKLRVKFRDIKNMEQFSYGPTFRIGYRWFHINAYYSLSKIFTKGNGPDVYPLSIGILLLPF